MGTPYRVDYVPAGGQHRTVWWQLQLAGTDLVPGQLPGPRGAGALSPLLRRRPQGGVPGRLGPDAHPAGGGAGAGAAALDGSFSPTASGRRPCHGDDPATRRIRHWKDLVLFHEYFDGDTGRGVGASHQTGWTALAVRCVEDIARRRAEAARPPASSAGAPRLRGAGDERADSGGRAHRVAGGGRARRIRLRDHVGRPHQAIPRAAAGGDHAADRTHGPGQRSRCLDRAARRAGRVPHPPALPARHVPRRRSGASLEGFTEEPWPTWTWRLRDGGTVEQELFVPRGTPLVAMRWRRRGAGRRWHARGAARSSRAGTPTRCTTPIPSFRFDARPRTESGSPGRRIPACPAVARPQRRRATAHDPQWYRASSTRRSAPVASTSRRTSPRPAVPLGARGRARPSSCWRPARRLPARARGSTGRRRLRRAGARPAASGSLTGWSARRRVSRRAAARGAPSWRAIPGSPTGVATRSSRCAASASPPAGWRRRGPSCWNGRATSRRACCRTASWTRAAPPEYNTVDASLWYVIAVHDYLRAVEAAGRHVSAERPARTRATRSAGSWPGTFAGRATASGRIPTASSPPASPGSSSPGWTRR